MGFTPSKATPNIWMCHDGDSYEYVTVYVDDLQYPKGITDMLTGTYGFKLKGTGPTDYHLGMSFTQNEHGQLCISPKRYIGKMVDLYKQMFKENPPSKAKSPLDSNDHPEIDMTEFFGEEGIQMYQLLIGSIQWAITILQTLLFQFWSVDLF
jgi:hypothetical protein